MNLDFSIFKEALDKEFYIFFKNAEGIASDFENQITETHFVHYDEVTICSLNDENEVIKNYHNKLDHVNDLTNDDFENFVKPIVLESIENGNIPIHKHNAKGRAFDNCEPIKIKGKYYYVCLNISDVSENEFDIIANNNYHNVQKVRNNLDITILEILKRVLSIG